MKKLLIFSSAILILSSCVSNEKRQAELEQKIINDSIALINSIEQERIEKIKADSIARVDSIAKAEILKQAKIAYGTLKFGMYENAVENYMKKNFRWGMYKELGDYEYTFFTFYNKSNRLYMLVIETKYETANFIDNKIKSKMDNLVRIVSSKYGVPNHTYSFPDIFDFKPGYIKWTNTWDIETKKIKIGLSENSEGSTYNVTCWIYDEPMREAEKNKYKKGLNQKIEKEADNF